MDEKAIMVEILASLWSPASSSLKDLRFGFNKVVPGFFNDFDDRHL